jgi:hypothetical protein
MAAVWGTIFPKKQGLTKQQTYKFIAAAEGVY